MYLATYLCALVLGYRCKNFSQRAIKFIGEIVWTQTRVENQKPEADANIKLYQTSPIIVHIARPRIAYYS